jgi:hypothetical protein
MHIAKHKQTTNVINYRIFCTKYNYNLMSVLYEIFNMNILCWPEVHKFYFGWSINYHMASICLYLTG